MKRLMKNKKGLEFKAAFFSIIALSMVVIAIGVLINDWNDTYDAGLNPDLDAYDKLDDVSSTSQTQKEGVTVKSSNTGEQFEDTSIRGVFGILNNIYAPFRIVFGDGGMIDSVTERFGLPDYIRKGIVTMIIMAITFALVAIFFRLSRDP